MTNSDIIFANQLSLMKEGKIGTTGKFLTVVINDEEKTIPEPEPIHTFQMWKSLGFKVKKGEKAIAKFTIWKYTNGKKKDEESEEENVIRMGGHCFMKASCFFSLSQVEKAS